MSRPCAPKSRIVLSHAATIGSDALISMGLIFIDVGI